MKLKPYPAMKDSGVAWLGEVPAHWGVQRLKQVSRLAYGDSLATESRHAGPVPVYGSNGPVGTHDAANTLTPCLVVGRKGSFGKVRFSVQPVFAIDTTFFVDRRCTATNIRWLYYLLGWMRLDSVSKDSAVPGLDRSDAYSQVVPVPPSEDQAAIVRFLEHADRKIRRAIRAKQKLVKLLEEEKQAIIHRAVTRGLDPNVRLKPSGVEWLGEVPEYWKLVPLKFASRNIQNGATPSTSEPAYYEGGTIPWFGPSSCGSGDHVGSAVRRLTKAAFGSGHARLIRPPALLVVVIGATAGRMALLLSDGATNQQITAYELRPSSVDPGFALYQLRSSEQWLRATASTATIPILDSMIVSRLRIALPSLTEQQSIVTWIEQKTRPLKESAERAEREISLLREYRTRLIADVVTGKLDVRATAAQLPDEAPQAEGENDVGAADDGDAGIESETNVDAETDAEHAFNRTAASEAASA